MLAERSVGDRRRTTTVTSMRSSGIGFPTAWAPDKRLRSLPLRETFEAVAFIHGLLSCTAWTEWDKWSRILHYILALASERDGVSLGVFRLRATGAPS